jgi:hypothetical protein
MSAGDRVLGAFVLGALAAIAGLVVTPGPRSPAPCSVQFTVDATALPVSRPRLPIVIYGR